MILLRPLARLVGFVLLVALAVVGAAVALFSIQGGSTGLSMPALADLVALPQLGEETDRFRAELEASGPAAVLSALSGLGAILLGILLIVGALTPIRDRLFTVDDSEEGSSPPAGVPSLGSPPPSPDAPRASRTRRCGRDRAGREEAGSAWWPTVPAGPRARRSPRGSGPRWNRSAAHWD